VTLEFGNQSSFTGEVFAASSLHPEQIFTVTENIWRRLALSFINYIDLRIFPMPKGVMTSFTLENDAGRTHVEFDAEANTWWLVGFSDPGAPAPAGGEPPRVRADRAAVATFLRDLQAVKMARQLPGERRDLGEIQTRVTATSDLGLTTELIVGDQLEIGRDKFWLAERSDYPTTFLIDIETFNGLAWPALFFRDRDVFQFRPEEVLAYRVLLGRDAIQLRRDAAGEPWQLVGRMRRPLLQKFIDDMIGDLAKLRIVNFVPRDGEWEGILFKEGRVTIEADVRESESELRTVRLELSRNPPEAGSDAIYAIADDAPYIYALRFGAMQRLRPRMEDLLDRRIAAGRVDQILTIHWIKTNADGIGPSDVVLSYAPDAGWNAEMKLPVAKAGPIDAALADALLQHLGSIEFDRLMSGGEIEQLEAADAAPLYMLRLEDAAGQTIESVVVYGAASNNAEKRAAARLGDSSMVRVNPGDYLAFDRFLREQLIPNLPSVAE
jgi:hypothetical protein